jgi:hypothetical protein
MLERDLAASVTTLGASVLPPEGDAAAAVAAITTTSSVAVRGATAAVADLRPEPDMQRLAAAALEEERARQAMFEANAATTVTVQGVPYPLTEVTDALAAQMTDDEWAVWLLACSYSFLAFSLYC